jgi:hypothetical protein
MPVGISFLYTQLAAKLLLLFSLFHLLIFTFSLEISFLSSLNLEPLAALDTVNERTEDKLN